MSAAVLLDELDIAAKAEALRRIDNLYIHARVAVALGRVYLGEGDTMQSERVRDVLSTIRLYRNRVAILRGVLR